MNRITVNVVSESAFTVQAHGVHSAFLENCAVLERRQDVDLRVNALRASDLVHIHTLGPYALLHLLLGGGRKIVSAHLTPGTLVGSVVGAQSMERVARSYLAWFYNRADCVLAVSGQVVSDLDDLGVTAPVLVLPVSIDAKTFRGSEEARRSARARLGIDPDSFVVLSVGQLQPRKRVAVFIDCARSLPDIQFIWVGGILFGPLSAGRRDMVRSVRAAPGNATFVGKVERSRLIDHYHAADLFFFPSAHETFGVVIIEAAAAGLPLLLRDLELYRGQFPDAYVHGDESSFAELISRFADDKEFLCHWRDKSSALVARYDSSATVEHLVRTYRAILES